MRQAEYREKQAQVQLTQTQRQLVTNLYLYYNEALTARASVDTLRRTADLAAESLRHEVWDALPLFLLTGDDGERRWRDRGVSPWMGITGGPMTCRPAEWVAGKGIP